jgi:hypothetical protein
LTFKKIKFAKDAIHIKGNYTVTAESESGCLGTGFSNRVTVLGESWLQEK